MPFRIGPPRPLVIAPRFIDSIGATTILTRGDVQPRTFREASAATEDAEGVTPPCSAPSWRGCAVPTPGDSH